MPHDVEIDGVVKRYGRVEAVRGISLAVPPGEFLTLLGPSGCGKTTTLRMIGGFELPDAGRIFIQGSEVTRIPPAGRNTSMVFQDYALFPHMTVEENVSFGLRMRKTGPNRIRTKVGEILRSVGLREYAKRKPHQLSGGQRQRVALARSLVLQPAVLLLDEPLGALDAQIRRQMQMELKNIQKQLGQTFVYVTHDQEEAMTMSDRIAIMHNGRIEQMGTPAEVYEAPATPFVAAFLGECNLMEGNYHPAGQVQAETYGVLRGCPGRTVKPADGAAAVLCLRPEKIAISSPDANIAPERGTAEGIVRQVIYRGLSTKYIVTIGGGVVMAAETLGKSGIAPGTQVRLSWDIPDAIILPKTEVATGEETG
ncbi:MAG: ABC transporter ATP-binding protein [bacterium]|jgi:spermidine/putrescine ABC transporter ATP-binding subunit